MSLVCTPEQEAAINAVLPPHIRVRAIGGVLGEDIIAETGPGGMYEAAREIILSLAVAPSNKVD